MNDLALPATPFWVSAASRVIRALPAGRYRAMNWVARRRAPVFWASLPADFGGFRFRCDLRDPLMREVCITGRYEPQETALLLRLLQHGMTFVDVGANWGYFTLGAAHLVGETGRVISIEADPAALRTLTSNVSKNRLRAVTPVGVAASDRTHSVIVRRYGSGDESANFGVAFLDALDRDESGPSLEIPARPIDDILDEHGIDHVDLLKMDIEGAERQALTGLAHRLGTGSIDRLLVEVHPAHLRNQGVAPSAVVDAVRSFGYDAWKIEHSPAAHRRAAAGAAAESLLSTLTDSCDLGEWPHLLFVRRGLTPLGQDYSSK